MPTIEDEYRRSELVIKGRLIGIDTLVVAANNLSNDRDRIKYGWHKNKVNSQKFVRAKFLVQSNYKSSTALPDTIYVLTNADLMACGFIFSPFFDQLSSYYDFIIYGDRWVDYSTKKIVKGKHQIIQMKKVPSQNTFYTSGCRLTKSSNDTDIQILDKLKT